MAGNATHHNSGNCKDAIPRVKLVQKLETGLRIRKIVFLESALSYLLFTETGEVYKLENGHKNVEKLDGECSSSQLQALYASSRHSLVVQSGDKLLVKRDHNGVFLLQKAFVENLIENDNADIEIPVQEITLWQSFFTTELGRATINECDELQTLEDIMKDAMEKHLASGSNSLTTILNIPNIIEFSSSLQSAVNEKLKLKCNIYPVFPLVYWLIERIRWALDREKPYHILGNKDVKGQNIHVSVMNNEAARVLSFYKWPHMDYNFALPYRMAETGFFFQPNKTGEDRVVCFSCNISLVMWEAHDIPMQEHERHYSSQCKFMEDMCNDNVPLDVTTACQPSISLPFDNESAVVPSTMNASAEFFAIADANNISYVRMIHLDSAPLQQFVIELNFINDLRFTLGDKMVDESDNESSSQLSKITALSVAGHENFEKTVENIDADADCLLYVGAAIDSKLIKDSSPGSHPYLFVYKVSRHLRENITPLPPRPPPPAAPISYAEMFPDGEPSSSSGNIDDDAIDVSFWSPDDMTDDNYEEFKAKLQKKYRARLEDSSPSTEIDYNPYKLKYTYVGLIRLEFLLAGEWLINNIATSDVDDGLISVSAYNENENRSAVLHFSRRFNFLQPSADSVKIKYFNGKIQKLTVLPVDHFASFRITDISDPEPFGQTVSLGNTLVLTDLKELFLLDSVSGENIKIDSEVMDFNVDDVQNLMIANSEGEMKTIHIAASLTGMQSEKIDEIAFSLISQLKNSASSSIVSDISDKFSAHPSITQVMDLFRKLYVTQPLTPNILDNVYSLIKSKPVKSIATQTRVMTQKTAIAALESTLQHSLGFQMSPPPHWTENIGSTTQKITPSFDATSPGSSQKSNKETFVKDEHSNSTRTWRFMPEKEKPRSNYVFKMAIIPGMPLSHINFKFNFVSNSNGCPDAAFTIYRAKEEPSKISFNGLETSNLIPYCDDPTLLDSECEKILGPFRLDTNSSDNAFSLIQVSSTVILESLSAANLKEDWFTKPVFLYLLIEVSKRPSLAQQINTRTQLIAQAVKTRSRSDKARVSRVSGGYKKKFHPRKAFIAKNTKNTAIKSGPSSSACRLAIIKRKDISSTSRSRESPPVLNPNESKDCIMYIEEFGVTLFRHNKLPNGHEQLQRFILQKDGQLHRKLFDIALNVENSDSACNASKTQLQALELLLWVTQGWRISSKFLPGVLNLLESLLQNYQKWFMNGFVRASNHVAQKWNTLVGQLLKIVSNQESVDCENLFTQLINYMKASILNDLEKIEKAGSLHWFLATVFTTVYESTYLIVDGTHVAAANELSEKCLEVLKKMGDTFQKKWNTSLHHTLSIKYGLSGLVFDLNMFDFPEQFLGYRTLNESYAETEKNAISNYFKGPTHPMMNTISGYTNSSGLVPFGPGFYQHPKPQREIPKAASVDGEVVSGKLFPYSDYETCTLTEMLNLNIGKCEDNSSKQPWLNAILSEGDWFDMDEKIIERNRIQNDILAKFSWTRFSVEMPGLLEYEPLSFECIGPADYVQVYNCDTHTFSNVSTIPPKVLNTKAPEVMRVIASIENMESNKSANFQLSNEIFSIFKPPSDFVLCIERATANIKRQIVLDFGGPTLLKAFIIPPSEYVHTVYVDAWWTSEELDCVRIAQSKTIKNKALIISNMQPGILVQKLKLTYIMKGTTGKSRIAVGRFFGTKWLTKADVETASLPFTASSGDPITVKDVCIDAASAINLSRIVQYFCEEVRCRYVIAAAELKKLVEEGYSITQVKEAYVNCFNLKLQWNISYNVMEKLQAVNQPLKVKQDTATRNWNDLDAEHLKSLCSSLLHFSNELSNVLDLRDSTLEVLLQTNAQPSISETEESSLPPMVHIQPTQILTLESALSFFEIYCTHNTPSNKALGCAHLFKNGCFTSWWGDFFPEILQKYFFGMDNNSHDNGTFLVLTILCSHSVKHSHLQQSVMEKLFKYVISISEEIVKPDLDEKGINNLSSLLSWTLQLLSTSFDVIACNKRKTDRWSFLAGLFGQSSTYAPSVQPPASDSSNPRILSNFDQLNTRDKILAKWKEMFMTSTSDDFLTELEKPQFISRRLAILQDRLYYLHALIREEFDGIPASMPPSRESFSPSNSTEPIQKSVTPPAPDPASTRLLIVPLHNLQSRVRVRQYSARIKISETLCLSVVQHLLDLLLHENSKNIFPHSSQLVALKVISKICLHGSISSIPLTSALGEKLYDFIFKMLNASKEHEWMKYALLMLLVDLTDAEIRSFGRNLSSRQMKTVMEEPDEIGIEAKRHKPDTEIEMSEENSVNNELSDHTMEDLTMPELDSFSNFVGSEGSTTAQFSGVSDSPWAFVPPSAELVSFSSFDRIRAEQVDEYVIRAATAVLIGLKDSLPSFMAISSNKNISEQLRFSTLLQWFYRLSRFYHDRGESLTHIFRFFDEAILGEEEHYLRCNTAECYTTTFSLAVFENTRLGALEECYEKSKSAQAFIVFCNAYFTEEQKAAALNSNEKSENIPKDALDLRFFQATIEAKYNVRLCGIRHLCREMQIPEVEIQKAISGHMARIRFKLPELTSIAIDANGDKMVSADPEALRKFDNFAVNAIKSKLDFSKMLKNDKASLEKVLTVYSKILFINLTWPEFEDFTRNAKIHIFSEQTLLELASSNGTGTPPELSLIGQNGIEPIQPLDTAELKCALENLTNEIPMATKIRHFNQAVHLQFAADLTVAGESFLVQPNEMTLNSLAEMQFGFQPLFESCNREQIRSTLSRNCQYNFVPHCLSSRKSGDENKEAPQGLGNSVRSVVNVINRFLSSLKPETDPESLLNVLSLYLEFTGYVHCITSSSTKSINLEKGVFEPPPLNFEAVSNLLNYVTVKSDISELLWQYVLSAITRNIKSKENQILLLSSISNSFNLRDFLQKFFADSFLFYGAYTEFGPTILESMGTLLSKLLASDASNGKLLEQYIDSLNLLFADPSSSTFGALPIETLSVLIDIVGQYLKVVAKDNICDVQKISLLLFRVVQMVKVAYPRFDGYLRNSGHPGKPPGSSTTQLSQANLCFTVINPPSAMSSTPENKPSIDTFKLPELSFTVSKSPPSENTNSFRRAKHPNKMWQTASGGLTDPFDYEFESGYEIRGPYGTEQVFEKKVDRTETLFVLLIKFINSCSQLGPLWTIAVQKYPQTISIIIDLLNQCQSAVDPVTEVYIEFWNPQTLADHLLYVLLSISSDVGVESLNAKKFMQLALQSIFKEDQTDENKVAKISDPLIFALTKLNYQLKRKELFVELRGHEHIAEQLKKCLQNINNRWPFRSNVFSMGQQLTSVANEVVGIVPQTFDVQNLPTKMINGIKVYNFSPASRINGHSINTSSLANILTDPPTHRRSRQAAYGYSFPQGELWTSVTIALPCQIILYEVQIKCHQYSLNTPSAIQIELSADCLPARNWQLFGENFVTAGLISTIIDTSNHLLPVGALKIHLKRPNGYNGTINLSQIIVYGTVTSQKMRSHAEQEKSLINWLTLFDRFQLVQPSLSQYASMLPQKLMQLFIQMSNEHRIYPLLKQVISNIDHRSKSNEATIIELILKHIFGGGRLGEGYSPIISAEMLYSFCTESENITFQRAAIRQQQLLAGTERLLSLINDKNVFDDKTFTIILWASSCIIWTNVGNERLRYQTVATCIDVGKRIRHGLWNLAVSTSPNHKLIKASAAWLLCSLFRADPNLVTSFSVCQQNKIQFSKEEFGALSKIYQSESAATELINSGMLMKIINECLRLLKNGLKNASSFDSKTLTTLINYLEFIAELCVIDVICVFLQQPDCQELFKLLLPALVYCAPIKTSKEMLNNFANLEKAALLLCQKCISYGNEHRKLISNILTELIANEKSKFCGRIDGTLLHMILRLVLEDEVISIRVRGLQGPNYAIESFSARILNPVFGCISTDRIFEVSLFTFLRDLIPLRQSEPSNQKMNAPGVYDELSSFENFISSHKKKSEPQTQEQTELADGVVCDELGQKLLVARIFCEQISFNESLNLKNFLKNVFWHTSSLKNNGNYVFDQNGKISKPTVSDPKTFGYLTLLTEIRVTSRNEGTSLADLKFEVPSDDLTMLQHFAIAGGFSELSHHFPMADHYSFVLETFEGLSKKQRESNAKASRGPTAENAAPPKPPKPSLNQVAFATQQFQQQLGHVLGQVASTSSNLQAMIAGTPVSLSVLEPSSIIGYANEGGPQSTLAAVLPSSFSGPNSSSLADNSFQAFGNAFNYMMNSAPSQAAAIGGLQASVTKTLASLALNSQKNANADKDVPAYSIFALSMFLKLDYYAISLVTCDRFQAKRVLRSAMGISAQEKDIAAIMSNFRPIMPKTSATSCPIIVNQLPERKLGVHMNASAAAAAFYSQPRREIEKSKRDSENLTIYPFYVLEKVWILSGPSLCGKEIFNKIRFDNSTQDVLDVILLCTSRFSNTPSRWQITYPPSSDAQAIDQIFQITDRIDVLRDAMAAAPPPNTVKQMQGIPMSSTLMQSHEAFMMNSQQATQAQQDGHWAKGTGFGTGNTHVQWNLNEHVRRRKLGEEAVTCMINLISGYLMPYDNNSDAAVLENVGLKIAQFPYDKAANFHNEPLNIKDQVQLTFSIISKIYNSCLMPVIHSYLTNDSVFDISKHVAVYEACIWFVITIASLKPIQATEDEMKLLAESPKIRDVLASMLMEEEFGGSSILNQMRKMHEMIKIYLSTIDKEKKPEEKMVENEKAEDGHEEENLEALAFLLQKALTILEHRLNPLLSAESEDMEVDSEEKDIASMTCEDIYMQEMKVFQYESIPFFKSDDNKTMEIPHHYSSTFLNSTSNGNSKQRMRRLAQEAITLSKSLPLSFSSSVFMKACEERLDVFKILITGPSETPYSAGCFEFDAYMPPDYPNVPVQISLQTTGGNSVRFNPNLYNDGKVCLSILNTWHGRPEERWNSETSSFLQVIVSIQSLILVNEPYFNEPGYERSRNTPAGQQAARDYDANIRNQTVRWAMLEQIRFPPKGFEDVVRRHFYIKRDDIYLQISEQIAEMQKLVDAQSANAADPSLRITKTSLAGLIKNFDLLKEEFAKMTPPAGLENLVSQYFPPKNNDVLMEELKSSLKNEESAKSQK